MAGEGVGLTAERHDFCVSSKLSKDRWTKTMVQHKISDSFRERTYTSILNHRLSSQNNPRPQFGEGDQHHDEGQQPHPRACEWSSEIWPKLIIVQECNQLSC